jgi:hypothetical protein
MFGPWALCVLSVDIDITYSMIVCYSQIDHAVLYNFAVVQLVRLLLREFSGQNQEGLLLSSKAVAYSM